MNGNHTIALTINGEPQQLHISGNETLLTVLRDRLYLTGSKRGCNQGICGACTLQVDGINVRGCLTLAALCDGTTVTTVEGLATISGLSPIQKAFAETGAVQCGFCTAGMMMAANEFLAHSPRPSADEARQALAGNICRCTGYKKIIDAVLLAAEMMSEEATA